MKAVTTTLGASPTEKLMRTNFLLWKMQVLPAVRGALIMGLLDGSDAAPCKTLEVEDTHKKMVTVPNPAYVAWMARDQQVFSWLVKSLSPDILSHVLGAEHCMDASTSIEEIFTSQSKAQINTLRGSLANTKKLDMKAGKFIIKMRGFAMELAAAGKRIDDDELKGYILNGLGADYTPFVASINVVPSTTLADMCVQLTAYDQHQSMLSEFGQDSAPFQSSVNGVVRGRGCPTRPSNPRGGYDQYRGPPRGPDYHDYRGNSGGGQDYRSNYGGWAMITVAILEVAMTFTDLAHMITIKVSLLIGTMEIRWAVVPTRGVVVVAVVALPPLSWMFTVRFARSMIILHISVGGASRIVRMMMMISTLSVKVLMAWIQICIWTLLPLILALES
ncbi:hypothetical protein ACQ4PT_030646 [Festuca glaucescens]